jgi:predicted RNA binding protein YcfA (HicA-like mRNA interferase family)
MSKLEKLIEFLLSRPTEAAFSDVKRVLEAFGFEEDRSSGSHHIFRHEDGRKLTVPKKEGRNVKGIYIKKVITLLGLEDEDDQEED